MGLRGTLTRDRLGYSMPCDAPLYPAPPYLYEGAAMLAFEYETDPAAAAALLPAVEGLELVDPPTAGLVFAHYPSSSLGPYDEVVLYLEATYRGDPVKYGAYLYVTTDAAMAAGRETGGFPKKIGRIGFEAGATYQASLERPAGRLLATARFTPATPPVPVEQAIRYFTLRVVPSPVLGAPPTITELVDSTWQIKPGTARLGDGAATLAGDSPDDPLHRLPILRPLGAKLIEGTLSVGLGKAPTIPLP